jgi:hypothetical protein
MASYGIALWAMTRAPVAAVSALRETSVLFASRAVGVACCRSASGWQRMHWARWSSSAGVVSLRLS